MSEYEKFLLAWLWCYSRHPVRELQAMSRLSADFVPLVDFSRFSSAERVAAVDVGVLAGDVFNAIRRST